VGAKRLAEHEAEDEDDDEDALPRVDDDRHPRALPPPRRIGEIDEVRQGGGDRPRGVQMVEGEKQPVGDEIDPSKDAPHSRQQKPPKEQFLALLSMGVIRCWRWAFWLIFVAFLFGPLRVVASVLALGGVLSADGPTWYVLYQALLGLLQFIIALAMLAGYRRAGAWGTF
jgi:hypothetical protein